MHSDIVKKEKEQEDQDQENTIMLRCNKKNIYIVLFVKLVLFKCIITVKNKTRNDRRRVTEST